MILETLFVLAFFTQLVMGIIYLKAPSFVADRILKLNKDDFQQMMFVTKAAHSMLLSTLFLVLTVLIPDEYSGGWKLWLQLVLLLPLLVSLLWSPNEESC